MTTTDLTTRLLPVLGRSLDVGFNVFDVMHHGTHEKQLSNVFRWFLEIGGTHNFQDLGQRLFVEQMNLSRSFESALPLGSYTVRQEVNTSDPGEAEDIADIVLENESSVIVIENYETSDGHGHSYEGYLKYGRRDGKRSAVALLCAEENKNLQTHGWEHAPVITYERFLDQLIAELDSDSTYASRNPEQYAFINQMHRKYARGKGRMSDKDVLDFVTAMCATGEARRYQEQSRDLAAERFASDIAQQARERFGEGREAMQRVKTHLRAYGSRVLSKQLNATLGSGFVERVNANYSGIYQWTISFETGDATNPLDRVLFQIKFGPSAWYANEEDEHWKQRVPTEVADYSRLFLTRNHLIRQSSISLHEVIEGLAPEDMRLHDEIVALLAASWN